MGQTEFKTRLLAPYFAEIPLEIKDKWVSGEKLSNVVDNKFLCILKDIIMPLSQYRL